MSDLLRVVEIQVKGLFGIYDHDLPLNSTNRVTIVHGPNGVGKTIVLKCVESLFRGHYSYLRRTPFKSFSVTLSDGSRLKVDRIESEARPAKLRSQERMLREVELVAELRIRDRKQVIAIKPSADVVQLAKMIEQNSPFIVQAGENLWIDRRTDRFLTSEELLEESEDFVGSGRLTRLKNSEPEELQRFRKRVRVFLIETERLVTLSDDEQVYAHSRGRSRVMAVNSYARQLQKKIDTTLAQYGRNSQQLDQSFPQRLIQDSVPELDLQELKRRMEILEERQRELSEIGLLDKVPTRPFDPGSLDSAGANKIGPMTLYLLDSEQKISVFDEVAARLKLLVNSATSKFKNKRLSISREVGLLVTGVNGERIDLESLSSGEQHELVLMYELLFKTPPNSLIMIDEPELSLHVTWQRLFLPEILSVAQQVGFDVILATHSPFIVGGRVDLLVGLDMDRDDMPPVDQF